MINRMRHGDMLRDGETLYTLEVAPAGYAALAANEAEKRADIRVLEMVTFGAFGRVWLGGSEEQIRAGRGGGRRHAGVADGPRAGGAAMTAAPIAPGVAARRHRRRARGTAARRRAVVGRRLRRPLLRVPRRAPTTCSRTDAIRTVGRGITLGLGVRVLKGDATGYAYTEELAWERMAQAARTAGQIAAGGARARADRASRPVPLADFYPVAEPSLVAPGATSSRCCAPPTRRRAPTTRASSRSRRRSPRRSSEVLVVTSDGRMARDSQPLMRFGVARGRRGGRASARAGARAAAGRFGMELLRARRPEPRGARARGGARGDRDARRASRRRPGEMAVVLGAGDSGILLHEAVGHGLEADFNRKRTSNYTDQIGKQVASPLCTVVDDGTIDNARGSINVDDEGNAGQRNVLIENGMLVGYMQDRLSREALRRQAVGQRPPPDRSATSRCRA